jgi:hypothetical protein
VNLCCREKEGHVHELAIRAAIGQFFSRPADCLPAINLCMEKFLNVALPSFFRSNIATIILFPALTLVPVSTASAFYATHIRTLCATVADRLPPDSAPSYPDQLFAKRGAAALLEAMYTHLPPSHVHGPGVFGARTLCCLFRVWESKREAALCSVMVFSPHSSRRRCEPLLSCGRPG